MLARLRLRRPSHATVVAYLGLFVALGGTGAYAANEWTGENIVDSSLTGQDIFNNSVPGGDITNGTLTGADVFDNTIGSADITNGSLTGADIADNSIGIDDIGSQEVGSDEVLNDSLLQSDIRAGAVTGDEVADNSLTGADIDEGSLNLPGGISTATFRTDGFAHALNDDGSFTGVSSKRLPAGSWAVVATANTRAVGTAFTGETHRDATCELRADGGYIGGATDRRVIKSGQEIKRSLSMNGGAYLPEGGWVVLWCSSQNGRNESVTYSQMMFLQVGGFS